MKPWEMVDRANAPDGAELVLSRRGDEWVVREGGRVLMSSRTHGSEEALAELALARAAQARSVLVGGLGLGFTVRATLDRLGPDAKVVVAEMVPKLVEWNRGPLAELAGRPLDDPRVRLQVGDVGQRIAEASSAYDAILLDVDNGPARLTHAANAFLYQMRGVRACRDALRAGGVLAVWSAGLDEAYLERLERAGLNAEARVVPARGSGQGGVRHVVFLATRSPARPGASRPSHRDTRPAQRDTRPPHRETGRDSRRDARRGPRPPRGR